MKVYIQEWRNNTASLLTANGQVIWTFSTTAEARQACEQWHSIIADGDTGCSEFSEEDGIVCCCLA